MLTSGTFERLDLQGRRHILIVTFFLSLEWLGATGCYPHRGLPTSYDADELSVRAVDACQRHDRQAWETFVRRLMTHYPDDPRAQQGALLIKQRKPCTLFSNDQTSMSETRGALSTP